MKPGLSSKDCKGRINDDKGLRTESFIKKRKDLPDKRRSFYLGC
jgi:hypothetical protein